MVEQTQHSQQDMNRRGKKSEHDKDDQQNGSLEKQKNSTNLISKTNELWNEVTTFLYQPVNGSSLICFRIIWGLILFLDSMSYLFMDSQKLRYLADLEVYFHYYGFDFVRATSFDNLWLITVGLAIASLMVSLGLLYRLASLYLFFGHTYLFLLERTTYLNHIYLMCMLCFLTTLMPLNQHFALDNVLHGLLFPSSNRSSSSSSSWFEFLTAPEQAIDRVLLGSKTIQMPYWPIWILQVITAIVYFYATVAKANEDC